MTIPKNKSFINAPRRKRAVIVGVGYVGATIAYALTVRNIADEIVLIDTDKEKTEGEALDIKHGIPYFGVSNITVGDYADCKDSDIIIICAGRGRKPGQSRRDLAESNIAVMRDIVAELKKYYTRGAILVVSNPVDILTYAVEKMMGLPNGVVFGTGCILDVSRLSCLIADYINLSAEAVKCSIVGEHGDNQIAIWSRLAIAGVPIDEYCRSVGIEWNGEIRSALFDSVKNMGGNIIKAKGRTHYGIATCVCYLAGAVLDQSLTIACVSSTLNGEYGVNDVALSVPSIIGVNGVERRLEEKWADDEHDGFVQSANRLKKFMESFDDLRGNT